MARQLFIEKQIKEIGTDFVSIMRVQNKLLYAAKRILSDIAYGNFSNDDYIKYAEYFFDYELMKSLIDFTYDRLLYYNYICSCINYTISSVDKNPIEYGKLIMAKEERDYISNQLYKENLEYRNMFNILYSQLILTYNEKNISYMFPITGLIGSKSPVQRYFS